jgi:hypothetical protein
MKIKTFFDIYYRHRVVKAKFFLKLYLYLIIPFRYLLNIPYLPTKINLDQYINKNLSLLNMDLDYLFEYFNSDKGDYYIDQYMQPIKRKKIRIEAHGYSSIYQEHFSKIKNNDLQILELGSFYGNAAASFYCYFKNAKIYSGDIFPDLFRYKSNRMENFYINTSDEDSIRGVILEKSLNYDLIMEDASHSLKDQIISLFMLFKKISSGGLFICEELDFPDTRVDMNLNNEFPTLKQILLAIKNNKDFKSEYINDKDKQYFLNNYSSIEIFKGKQNEVAIIKKK